MDGIVHFMGLATDLLTNLFSILSLRTLCIFNRASRDTLNTKLQFDDVFEKTNKIHILIHCIT